MSELVEPPCPPAAKLRKAVFAGFASTVVFGLAVSAWYLGNRILAADGARFPAPAQVAAVVASPPAAAASATAVTSQPVEESSTAQPDEQPISLEPVLYLEIAALGSPQDARYLGHLEARGFPGRIEAGQGNQAGRILIGPYTDQGALKRARRRLAAAGILAMETVR